MCLYFIIWPCCVMESYASSQRGFPLGDSLKFCYLSSHFCFLSLSINKACLNSLTKGWWYHISHRAIRPSSPFSSTLSDAFFTNSSNTHKLHFWFLQYDLLQRMRKYTLVSTMANHTWSAAFFNLVTSMRDIVFITMANQWWCAS